MPSILIEPVLIARPYELPTLEGGVRKIGPLQVSVRVSSFSCLRNSEAWASPRMHIVQVGGSFLVASGIFRKLD